MTIFKTTLNFQALSKRFSDGGLTKKAYLNALAATLDYGARLVVGLAINPLMLAGLGDYLYGVLQILGRLILYISAASGRPTQALKWTIANQQASTDYEAKRRNLGAAIAVWLFFLPILATIGALLIWIAPTWLNAPMELSWIVRLAAGIMVVDLVLTSLADVPQSVLQGENLGYKRMGLSTLLVFVGGGGFTAIALYFKTGLVGVVAADLGYTLFAGAFFLHVARRCISWFGIARPSVAELRQFFGLSWWFFVWRLVIQLMMSSDVIVLGRLNSVEEVTTYTLTKYIPETLISLVAIVVTGITPGLGGVIGSRNVQKAVRVRNEIMAGTWLIATVVGTTILLWNQDFVQLWVGKAHYSGNIPTMMIMLMITQFVLIRNDANIIDLSLNLRHKVLIGTLSATLSIVFSAVLVGFFHLGVTGLCFGFIAGRSILSLGYPWLVGRFLGVSLYAQLKDVPRPAFVTLLLFTLALSASEVWTARTWIGLILAVGVTVVVVSFLAFYIGLSSDQRRNILQRVRLVLRPAASD
jgi:O-antigen/teichoic acid export membrane protein